VSRRQAATAAVPSVAVVVLAGGCGLPVGQGQNKAYLPLGGAPRWGFP
jgi:2-C-methyl-D-erythritol 4-phosphate cytidylyltransferase